MKAPFESVPMIFRAAALAFVRACPLFFVEIERGELLFSLRGSSESEPQDGPPTVEKVGEPGSSPAGEAGCAESTACDRSPPFGLGGCRRSLHSAVLADDDLLERALWLRLEA